MSLGGPWRVLGGLLGVRGSQGGPGENRGVQGSFGAVLRGSLEKVVSLVNGLMKYSCFQFRVVL